MLIDTKEAPCLYLHQYTGGSNLYCREPHNCGECPLFRRKVENLSPDETLTWACWRCVAGEEDRRIARGTLLGYYQEGRCSWCGKEGFLLNAVVTS